MLLETKGQTVDEISTGRVWPNPRPPRRTSRQNSHSVSPVSIRGKRSTTYMSPEISLLSTRPSRLGGSQRSQSLVEPRFGAQSPPTLYSPKSTDPPPPTPPTWPSPRGILRADGNYEFPGEDSEDSYSLASPSFDTDDTMEERTEKRDPRRSPPPPEIKIKFGSRLQDGLSPTPKGDCRYLMLNPKSPEVLRCACVGFNFNPQKTGMTCDCGHQACYHEPGKENRPVETRSFNNFDPGCRDPVDFSKASRAFGRMKGKAWKSSDTYSPVNSTISKDKTMGEFARQAELLAHFGRKMKPCMFIGIETEEDVQSVSTEEADEETRQYREGVEARAAQKFHLRKMTAKMEVPSKTNTMPTNLGPTRLFLGNLPENTTKADLEAHFASWGTGKITGIKLMKGFGFLDYNDHMEARDFVPAFHGSDFMGQPLCVNFARGARPLR